MKSLTKSTKDQKIIILNGDNEEDIFKKWLDVIGMLEEDFLKFSETDGFEIRKKLLETDHNFYEISMLFKKNNVEEKIGYSFLVKADDAKELSIVVRILTYRLGEKFSVQVEKDIFYRFKMVCVLNGKMTNIGETIVVPQNEETLMDAIYLMLFISKKLDDANKKDSAYGSYEGAYFSDKVREFAKELLKEWRCL